MPTAKIDFADFGTNSLASILDLRQRTSISLYEPFGQLRYIEDYLAAQELGCRSVAVERHYIDRDHMHDHSAFYSLSLWDYKNWCQRAHFFKADKDQVRRNLGELLALGTKGDADKFKSACQQFSNEFYLGFSVIKPLSGSPVGRTVLACFPKAKEDGTHRIFPGTRVYKAHLAGIELSVRGLGFQQQDLGVSACATTALWCSLQKLRDREELGGAVPAQITQLASRFTLPFGRPMPSEGLSVDQMCMAVQGLGLSPNLLRAETFVTGRGLLHSAIRSGFAPVLILERNVNDEAHAVAVAGANVQPTRAASSFIGAKAACTDEVAAQLNAVYIHDDRYGPYLRADLKDHHGKLHLEIIKDRTQSSRREVWKLSHILIPSHPKIRLSFSALRRLSFALSESINAFRVTQLGDNTRKAGRDSTVTFENWFERNILYSEDLTTSGNVNAAKVFQLFSGVSLSRYIGVIRLKGLFCGTIDVLVDSTCTPSNLYFLAIVVRQKTTNSELVARHLSYECQCPFAI